MAVVHGGPGAPGEMAPVARELASMAGVLEPLQTADTVEAQVAELRDVLQDNAGLPATLIGFSWGAVLSFMLAAKHPSVVGKLVLVSSAPYDESYAVNITTTRLERLGEEDRREVLSVAEALEAPDAADRDALFARLGRLMTGADMYDPLPHDTEVIQYQYDVYQSVWQQVNKLRGRGELLSMAERIECPVVAIHGDYDPHPAGGVREPLSRVLKDFRFVLLERCGHYPWLERHARDEFYRVLKREL